MEETRICSITGEEMESGCVFQDGEMYFKYESDLIEFLRSHYKEMMNGLSDADVLEFGYKDDLYYYSEWFVERLD